MPAPTALLRAPEEVAEEETPMIDAPEDNDILLEIAPPEEIEAHSEATPTTNTNTTNTTDTPMQESPTENTEPRPQFSPAKDTTLAHRIETRKVPVPPHRFSPLKQTWSKIYTPLVEHLKLQCRMNIKNRTVELRTSKHTTDTGALQKGEDFVKAFTLGFDIDDAIALLRLDDLYIETFEIKDVKTLNGDHLSRAIGRIAGKDGKTKFAIENASKTRVVLADSKIHILGGFKNIHIARESIVSLILGAPPGKVYHNLRTVSARMKERF
ncbi:eukaryotic type KH-domain (KH-domain type I) [Tothia fuscella]|uniref:Pre-rRNA-processing protein PNO1 n=1 Tax=Tothia fuscella TaxID=1048955 RepID=A0A9P4U3I7_9PEZI|nr:eukaryotic type KH-domain (KH-domain type I) [Tothia fuscella]